jgi:hypothetical protein
MSPAEGERHRLAAGCVGDILVGRVPITLHDAAIVLEQLQAGAPLRSPRSRDRVRSSSVPARRLPTLG